MGLRLGAVLTAFGAVIAAIVGGIKATTVSTAAVTPTPSVPSGPLTTPPGSPKLPVVLNSLKKCTTLARR